MRGVETNKIKIDQQRRQNCILGGAPFKNDGAENVKTNLSRSGICVGGGSK